MLPLNNVEILKLFNLSRYKKNVKNKYVKIIEIDAPYMVNHEVKKYPVIIENIKTIMFNLNNSFVFSKTRNLNANKLPNPKTRAPRTSRSTIFEERAKSTSIT
jgi:hypothetical protein